MNLLTPDLGLLFWMALSFVIVFVILYKYGFPIITGSINKRKEFIEQSLRSAEEANTRLASIQQEGDKLLQEAHTQQQEIIAGAMAEKQQIVQNAKQEATDEAHRISLEAAQHIEQAKQDALSDVKDEVAALALQIAGQVIGERMKDDAEQQRVIERLLEKI